MISDKEFDNQKKMVLRHNQFGLRTNKQKRSKKYHGFTMFNGKIMFI